MSSGIAWSKILVLATAVILAVTAICFGLGWFRNKGD